MSRAALLVLAVSVGAVGCGGSAGTPHTADAAAVGVPDAVPQADAAIELPAASGAPLATARTETAQDESVPADRDEPGLDNPEPDESAAAAALSASTARREAAGDQQNPRKQLLGPSLSSAAAAEDDAAAAANPEWVSVTLMGDETLVDSVAQAETSEASQDPTGGLTPSRGLRYVWFDGDVELPVWADTRLVLLSGDDADAVRADAVVADWGEQVVADSSVDANAAAAGSPVFWSGSGELMTLPGGIVLILDSSWDAAAVDAFMGANGLGGHARSSLGGLLNAFEIAADAGLASLRLANSLAGIDGVEVSSPAWSMTAVPQ
ncbi:MAG: hypothetical protein F4117_12075 [Acidimicrobiales bacterium]|nr:hypothetical protein [Acidimicrobiales bacterium]MYB82059.1 hypothetical protein [Acidimicrobiales bacterium]MYI13283.1 hypothetical protein [Acidimicrobiales bacterium]